MQTTVTRRAEVSVRQCLHSTVTSEVWVSRSKENMPRPSTRNSPIQMVRDGGKLFPFSNGEGVGDLVVQAPADAAKPLATCKTFLESAACCASLLFLLHIV